MPKSWGESFLKSGLPLEHVTAVALSSLGCICSPNFEYERVDDDGVRTSFEIDVSAWSGKDNVNAYLNFLIECKYHDASRFWIFHPHERDRWSFNDRVYNIGPLQLLRTQDGGQATGDAPGSETALELAPLSYRGVVVSEDGQKQENALEIAIAQLAHAFVPYCLDHFKYLAGLPESSMVRECGAVVPMIVTNARMFRLRPDVTKLDVIRDAKEPSDIADELKWTWCYYDPPHAGQNHNERYLFSGDSGVDKLLKVPRVFDRLCTWVSRPNWIAVIRIEHLTEAVESISSHFQSLGLRSVPAVKYASRRKRRRAR